MEWTLTNFGRCLALRLSLAGAALCLLVGCNFPQDPNRTLERVQGGTMRVGVITDPPWTERGGAGDAPAGVEPALVQDFARRKNAHVEWVWGSEDDTLQALKEDSLDLVIGGLTEQIPWANTVALTAPYLSWRVEGPWIHLWG